MATLQHSAFLGVVYAIWREGVNYVIRKLFLAAYAESTWKVLLVLLYRENLFEIIMLKE